MSFGDYLRRLRNNKGLSLRETAKRAEMSSSYLSQLENGHNTKPNPDILGRLSKVLDVDYMDLVFQTELVQKIIEEEADKETDTIIKNYNRYRDIKGLTIYDEYTFKIEKLFADTTAITYNDVPLSIEEKKELLSFADYLHTKRNNEK